MKQLFGILFLTILFFLLVQVANAQSKDYYEVLNVARTADSETIQKAYRKVAMDNHPDRFPGDAQKMKTFIDANNAYEVLGDEEKRKIYDQTGSFSPRTRKTRPSSKVGLKNDTEYVTAADVIANSADYQIFLMRRMVKWQNSATGTAMHQHMRVSRLATPIWLFKNVGLIRVVTFLPILGAVFAKPEEKLKFIYVTLPLVGAFYLVGNWYFQLRKVAGLCQIFEMQVEESIFGILDLDQHLLDRMVWGYTTFDLMRQAYEATTPSDLPQRWRDFEMLLNLQAVTLIQNVLGPAFILRLSQMSAEARDDFMPFLMARKYFWLEQIAQVEALATRTNGNIHRVAPELATIKLYLQKHSWLSSLDRGPKRCAYWMARLFNRSSGDTTKSRAEEIAPL